MRYERLTGHRPHRAADQGQPDVRDRQDRLDDDGRHDARGSQGLVRHGTAGSVRRSARARRRLALQLFPGLLPRRATPTGWNNLVFPNVAMPHVLWQLGGHATSSCTHEFDRPRQGAGAAAIAIKGTRRRSSPGTDDKWYVQTVGADADAPGTMTPVEYQAFVADLVNFLDYMAEPTKNQRISLGIVVLLVPRRAVRARLRAEARRTGRTFTSRTTAVGAHAAARAASVPRLLCNGARAGRRQADAARSLTRKEIPHDDPLFRDDRPFSASAAASCCTRRAWISRSSTSTSTTSPRTSR